MGTPIIDSAVADPAIVSPGGQSRVTVVAHDPDARIAHITATATDTQGNSVSVTVDVQVADPLVFSFTSDVGTVDPDPAEPNVGVFTAPS